MDRDYMYRVFGPGGPPPMMGDPFPQPPFAPRWMQSSPVPDSFREMFLQATPEFPYMMGHEGGTGNGKAATRKAGDLV